MGKQECWFDGEYHDCDKCPLNIKNKEAPICDSCTYKRIGVDFKWDV